MTSGGCDRPPPRPARLAANRRNALRSTGPKSPSGKWRSARNALKHGLAVPVRADPGLLDRVEALARLIAGEAAPAARLAPARRAAEAQVDLDRVRAARLALLAHGLGVGTRDPAGPRPCAPDLWAAAPADPRERPAVGRSGPPRCARSGPRLADAPRRGAAVLHDVALWLERLDRYEARARSRRRSAIRVLDAALGEGAGDGGGLAGSVRQNEANQL